MSEREDQSETIAFLSDPATYGVPRVERIDTHAAIIFLAGEQAFKLKRAVRFPYLDFSTADRRKAVCEAELALNRRTAPDLYLSAQCIGRGDDGALTLGSGEPVDWVVVMRRFASDRLFSAMAKDGALPPALMRELADEIAAFHEEAEEIEGPGADRVRAVIDGIQASMAALEPGALPQEDCDRLHHDSIAALDALKPLLDERARHGFVRHCHGDLHLANICLWQGRPTLFDCLEFDAELARTDVLYDVAFLVMDLWQRGLRAEASLVFNRYCDMRGEADGLAAMPLFLSMRAAVRAHVEASAAGRQGDAGERKEKLAAARAYLDASLDFLHPRQPRLVAVGGLSGTGKSTLAGLIAPRIGTAPAARWLRSDVLRKRLAGVSPEQPLPPGAYTRGASDAVYRQLMEQAEQVLAAGLDVIVDAVFAAPAERQAIADVAARCGAAFTGLWLDAPPEVLRARVTGRTGDASDADARVVDLQLGYDIGDLSSWHRLNSQGEQSDLAERALQVIGRQT